MILKLFQNSGKYFNSNEENRPRSQDKNIWRVSASPFHSAHYIDKLALKFPFVKSNNLPTKKIINVCDIHNKILCGSIGSVLCMQITNDAPSE